MQNQNKVKIDQALNHPDNPAFHVTVALERLFDRYITPEYASYIHAYNQRFEDTNIPYECPMSIWDTLVPANILNGCGLPDIDIIQRPREALSVVIQGQNIVSSEILWIEALDTISEEDRQFGITLYTQACECLKTACDMLIYAKENLEI